jgi:hypothetical protein
LPALLVGKIRAVADAVAGFVSRAGCETVEEWNTIQAHREAIGKRVGGARAVTLSVTIAISLVVSLTATPMMCAYLLPQRREHGHSRLYRAGQRAFVTELLVHIGRRYPREPR